MSQDEPTTPDAAPPVDAITELEQRVRQLEKDNRAYSSALLEIGLQTMALSVWTQRYCIQSGGNSEADLRKIQTDLNKVLAGIFEQFSMTGRA